MDVMANAQLASAAACRLSRAANKEAPLRCGQTDQIRSAMQRLGKLARRIGVTDAGTEEVHDSSLSRLIVAFPTDLNLLPQRTEQGCMALSYDRRSAYWDIYLGRLQCEIAGSCTEPDTKSVGDAQL